MRELLDSAADPLYTELQNCFQDCKKRFNVHKKYACFVECSAEYTRNGEKDFGELVRIMKERDIELDKLLVEKYKTSFNNIN